MGARPREASSAPRSAWAWAASRSPRAARRPGRARCAPRPRAGTRRGSPPRRTPGPPGAPLGRLEIAPLDLLIGQVAEGHQRRRPRGPPADLGALLEDRRRLGQPVDGVEGDARREARPRPQPGLVALGGGEGLVPEPQRLGASPASSRSRGRAAIRLAAISGRRRAGGLVDGEQPAVGLTGQAQVHREPGLGQAEPDVRSDGVRAAAARASAGWWRSSRAQVLRPSSRR